VAEDLRLYADFFEHPKTQLLKQRLGCEGILALQRLWCAAVNNWRDGNLAGKSDEFLEMAAGWTGAAGALTTGLREAGFLDGQEFNSRLHNWAERQPWAAARGERIRNSREAAHSKWSKLAPEDRKEAASKAARARWDQARSTRLELARSKGTHTEEEWEALLSACGNRCLRCGAEDAPLVKDHIVPIYRTERLDASDSIDNLQPLCESCNQAKGADTRDLRPENWREATSMRAPRTHMRAPNPTTLLEARTSNPSAGIMHAPRTDMRATRTHEADEQAMMLLRVKQQLQDQGMVTGALAEWVRQQNITHIYVDGRPVAFGEDGRPVVSGAPREEARQASA